MQQEMSYLPSLSLSFHIFKMGIIKIIADNCLVQIKLNKLCQTFTQCLTQSALKKKDAVNKITKESSVDF